MTQHLPPCRRARRSGTPDLAGRALVDLGAPLHWLALGWRDLWRVGLPACCMAALAGFGALLVLLAGQQFWLLSGRFPAFWWWRRCWPPGCTAVTRAGARRAGQLDHRAQDLDALAVLALRRPRRLLEPGALWRVAGTGGHRLVLTSAALITALAPRTQCTRRWTSRHVVLAPGGHLFELWLTLGGLMAPLFASAWWPLPLLLDRRVDVLGSADQLAGGAATLARWRCGRRSSWA